MCIEKSKRNYIGMYQVFDFGFNIRIITNNIKLPPLVTAKKKQVVCSRNFQVAFSKYVCKIILLASWQKLSNGLGKDI